MDQYFLKVLGLRYLSGYSTGSIDILEALVLYYLSLIFMENDAGYSRLAKEGFS